MVGLLFALMISIGIPLVFFIYALVKRQVRPFFFGVLAFVLSQVLFRIPILQLLGAHSVAYSMFSVANPVVFAILLALSAALLEEGARYLFMRFLLKERSFRAGLLFGAGHGGIEAVLFLGLATLGLLFSTGTGADGGQFLIGGLERFFAMLLHIGLSLLVLRSVREGRWSLLFSAILIHTFVNSLAGIVPLYFAPRLAIFLIELILAILALALFIYHVWLKRKGVFS